MEPYYSDTRVTVYAGDCLDVLRELDDASVDAVVTDPPYGLEFMGKEWDSFRSDDRDVRGYNGRETGAAGQAVTEGVSSNHAARRNRAVAYGGGKHSTTSRCEGCGKRDQFRKLHACPDGTNWRTEIIDPYSAPPSMLAFQNWCREWSIECLRVLKPGGHLLAFGGCRTWHRLACAVEDAGFEVRDSIAWLYGSGFPKSLDVSKAIDKAAGAEREVVGRATGAANGSVVGLGQAPSMASEYDATAPATDDARTWQGWGTALKPAFEPVVVARKPLTGTVAANVLAHGTGALNIDATRIAGERITTSNGSRNEIYGDLTYNAGQPWESHIAGRWPANVSLDESQAAELDAMSGELSSGLMRAGTRPKGERETYGQDAAGGYETTRDTPGDRGGASRFFYTAKAPGTERVKLNGTAHPTVKPLDLMRWLVRLVTPTGGIVLDPFAGSGTTVEACLLEGFRCVAIEREPDYLPLIMQRVNRRIDPVAAVKATDDDGGLFDLLGEEIA